MNLAGARIIDAATVEEIIPALSLVDPLRKALLSPITVAPRTRHAIGSADRSADLLVMPAWQSGRRLGVKLVTVLPGNNDLGLPSINASYQLFCARTGALEAVIAANPLTEMRTAAMSVLGHQLLSGKTVDTLLMVGAGALAPHLVAAHVADARPRAVLVWNRSPVRAEALVAMLAAKGIAAIQIDALEEGVRRADLICCAAAAAAPLIAGDWIADGAHLSLLGSYRPEMREADIAAIGAGGLIVDIDAALNEAGDLIDAIDRGTIDRAATPALAAVLRGQKPTPGRITIFKSVGSAIADLAAAETLIERLTSSGGKDADITPTATGHRTAQAGKPEPRAPADRG